MVNPLHVHGLGLVNHEGDLEWKEFGAEGKYKVGRDGVRAVLATKDDKVEFIVWDKHTLAWIRSSTGNSAAYPLHPVKIVKPIQGILMDLDGTTVQSEEFWIYIIEKTISHLLGNKRFKLKQSEIPFVSGHSVTEHLNYCIKRYCPNNTIQNARREYLKIVHLELQNLSGDLKHQRLFKPAPGLKKFLTTLKNRGVKIALVTSGSYEKAWPEITSVFQQIHLGDPREFYDTIMTGGNRPDCCKIGTLGELEAKPHPWLYSEAACIGLGFNWANRGSVVGIDDSGAGIVSIRLAGYAAIGMLTGNIDSSGLQSLLAARCYTLDEVLQFIF